MSVQKLTQGGVCQDQHQSFAVRSGSIVGSANSERFITSAGQTSRASPEVVMGRSSCGHSLALWSRGRNHSGRHRRVHALLALHDDATGSKAGPPTQAATCAFSGDRCFERSVGISKNAFSQPHGWFGCDCRSMSLTHLAAAQRSTSSVGDMLDQSHQCACRPAIKRRFGYDVQCS